MFKILAEISIEANFNQFSISSEDYRKSQI